MTEDLVQARSEEGLSRYQEAQTCEEYQQALDIFSELLEDTGEIPAEVRRNSMLLASKCMELLGWPEDAEPLLRNLLREVELDPDEGQNLLACARLSLAEVLSATDAWQEAIDLFLIMAAYFRGESDWSSEAKVHYRVARLWQDHHQLDRANAALDTAWSLLAHHEATRLHAQTLFAQGHCRYLGGDVESAIELEERALVIARCIGDSLMEEQLVSNLAEFTFTVQDFQRAIHYNTTKLREARTADDPEEITRCLMYLGACYTETGQPRTGIEMLDEARALLPTHAEKAGTCLIGKAQALVDMKRYDEAKLLLTEARHILTRLGADTKLLDRIEQRLIRETQGPLVLDCAHRVLTMVLAGSSRGVSHHSPQPVLNLTQLGYLTSDLTDEERARFTKLHKELSSEVLQTRWSGSPAQGIPNVLIAPLHFEYDDDVEAFEIKWAAYERELEYMHRCAELQEEWDEIRSKFRYAEGVFRGNSLDLITYVSQLAQIAELCAELGNRELLREVALHAADFLEMQVDDPMPSALAWTIRARLMIAAHIVVPSLCRELVEIEMRRSYDQVRGAFDLLDKERREAALEFIVEPWFHGATIIRGKDVYAGLVEIVGDLADSLEPVDHIRYGIAFGEAYDPAEGVRLVDSMLAQALADNPSVPIILAPEFEVALAVLRFKALAPDFEACLSQYGPFAPYIHGEVCDWADDVFPTVEQGTPVTQIPLLAFTDRNLAVMDRRLTGVGWAFALVHELSHRLRKTGQTLLAENGEWLPVKRDVPTASALTYFELLQADDDRSSLDLVFPQIQELISIGHRFAEVEPDRSRVHINNMLRYFDDLGRRETRASYPCAAVLLGIAFGYLCNPDAVRSYLEHLGVMDHDEAIIFGRKIAKLRL
jgi:tetratricopeptide (TPR) repeat protein